MILDLPLHHIGVASHDIEREEQIFFSLGYTPSSELFLDKSQGIRGRFLTAPNQPTLELLENMDKGSPVGNGTLDPLLKRGIKLYHFAYTTYSIEVDMERLQRLCKAKIIVPAMEATFFKKIGFVVLPNQWIVELVQRNDT